MSLDSETKRQIKIKTGVCKRLQKEVVNYKIEADKQQTRIDKLIADGKDESSIKKQREVKQESLDMIPDVTARLDVAVKDLSAYMNETNPDNDEIKDEDWLTAQSVLTDAKTFLSQLN